MPYDHKMQTALNDKHAVNPEKGDYWSDHSMAVLQVSEVVGDVVIFFDEKIQEKDTWSWSWNMKLPKALTKGKFAERVRYKSHGMEAICWCRVHPDRDF